MNVERAIKLARPWAGVRGDVELRQESAWNPVHIIGPRAEVYIMPVGPLK